MRSVGFHHVSLTEQCIHRSSDGHFDISPSLRERSSHSTGNRRVSIGKNQPSKLYYGNERGLAFDVLTDHHAPPAEVRSLYYRLRLGGTPRRMRSSQPLQDLPSLTPLPTFADLILPRFPLFSSFEVLFYTLSPPRRSFAVPHSPCFDFLLPFSTISTFLVYSRALDQLDVGGKIRVVSSAPMHLGAVRATNGLDHRVRADGTL